MLDFTLMRGLVRDVARSVSSNFPPYVTPEDTEGAIWVWVYDKKTHLETTVRDSPQDWERKIAGTMRKVAFDHCAKERAAAEGYSVDDLYRYSIPKIKSLMEHVFSYADWQSFGLQGDGQPVAKRQVNEGNDRVAELIDVRAAVARLPHDTKELLYYQYAMQYTNFQLGAHFGISEEAAKKRAQRALSALQKALGRNATDEQPKPAERRAVRTNAAWRANQSVQYDG